MGLTHKIFFLIHEKFQGTFEYTYLNNNDWIEKLEIYYEKSSIVLKIPPAFLKNITCQVEIKNHHLGLLGKNPVRKMNCNNVFLHH